MYKVFVRPSLEYATEIWSPYLVRDILLVEKVQRTFTRRLPGFSILTYEERLQRLELPSLSSRRHVTDLVMVYKLLHGYVSLDFNLFFERRNEVATRGHTYKLVVPRCRLNLRKYFFANRVVEPWNNLTQQEVDSPSVTSFRDRIARKLGYT